MKTTTIHFRHRHRMGDETLHRDFSTDTVALGETHIKRMIANVMHWKAEDVVLITEGGGGGSGRLRTRDLLGPDNGKGREDTTIDELYHQPEAMLGFVDPVRVKTLIRGREYVRDLFTCSVCGSLVEEDYRLAHVAWHETLP